MSGAKFERLLEIMARLRAPDGCPWDREQSLETLRPYLIEEAYEVLDAIERRDWEHLPEELGDLQLQIVFQAQVASEDSRFTIDDVLDRIVEKLIRRHPHVFGDSRVESAGEVVKRWEEIKSEERAEKGADPAAGLLDSVSSRQPALLEAYEMGKKAAKTGFDWERLPDLVEKLREECEEVAEAHAQDNVDRLEDEVGDLLFMAVNVARFLKVHPELALRRANRKFRSRFGYIEQALAAQGRRPEDSTLEEMEQLWQRAKGA